MAKARKPSAEEAGRKAEDCLMARELHWFVKGAWHLVEPDVRFYDNWHVRAICSHLEAVTDGRVSNLLINVPPGTMKSLLVNVFWPAWVWATAPGKQFMHSSYAESLSMRDSLKCRKIVASDWYQDRWPIKFRDDQDTKGLFENAKGGWRMVASIGGRGTGTHPDFLVGDDPHSVMQSESDAERQQVVDWLEGVFLTRGQGMSKNSRRVVVMQRLHMRDAAAVLLEKGGWTHLCFPMRFEAPTEQGPRMPATPLGFQDPRKAEGELLWPEMFPEERVATLESNLGLYKTAGQLQQRPSPRGGGTFQREWFQVRTTAPACLKLVRYWDKAGTRGGTGAESASVLIGSYVDEGAALPAMREKYAILHASTFRKAAAEREAVIKQQAEIDRSRHGHVTTWVEQEPGSGGKESAEATVGNLAGHACSIERVTGSKETRAEPLASQASVGKVCIVSDGGDWVNRLLDELENFPVGKLKDMVDAAGGAFNKLWAPTGAWSGVAGAHTGVSILGAEQRFSADRVTRGGF